MNLFMLLMYLNHISSSLQEKQSFMMYCLNTMWSENFTAIRKNNCKINHPQGFGQHWKVYTFSKFIIQFLVFTYKKGKKVITPLLQFLKLYI